MFGRATKDTSPIAACTDDLAEADKKGGNTIAGSGHWLLRAADDFEDGGKLYVSDGWVVLINPARMSAEEAAALQTQAENAQKEINELLLKVGAADDAAAAAMQDAVAGLHVNPLDPKLDPKLAALFTPGSQPPADAVPNPSTPQGALQQATIRG